MDEYLNLIFLYIQFISDHYNAIVLPDVIKYLIYDMFYVVFYFRVTSASLFMRFK